MPRFAKQPSPKRTGSLSDFFMHQTQKDQASVVRVLKERLFVVKATAKHRTPQSQTRQLRWLQEDLRHWEKIKVTREAFDSGLFGSGLYCTLKGSPSTGSRLKEDMEVLKELFLGQRTIEHDADMEHYRAILESARARYNVIMTWDGGRTTRRRREFWAKFTGKDEDSPWRAWYYLCLWRFWNQLWPIAWARDMFLKDFTRRTNAECALGANVEDP